jgi:hypothetical protein|eukprot:COSAG01_NODE_1655_length_9606_cov_29.510361_4_plen_78_part_00
MLTVHTHTLRIRGQSYGRTVEKALHEREHCHRGVPRNTYLVRGVRVRGLVRGLVRAEPSRAAVPQEGSPRRGACTSL